MRGFTDRSGLNTSEVVVDASRRWLYWLTATLLSFLALEAHALRKPLTDEKPSETLTAAFRYWLGVQPASRRRWIASTLFAGFWAWFVGHCIWGWGPNDLPRRSRPPTNIGQ